MFRNVNRKFACLFLAFVFAACNANKSFEVDYYGALKNAMKQNDLSSHISSDDLDLTNFYALGALEGLKGELLILNGEVYTSIQKDTLRTKVIINKPDQFSANFMVGARIDEWSSFEIPFDVKTKTELEEFVAKTGLEYGIDSTAAFPFLIEGLTTSISWHVVNWNKEDTVHTHEKHVKSGAYASGLGEKVTVLGFYSNQHHGIFTHHSSNIHLHVLNENKTIMGHLDDFVLGERMILKLPK